MTAHELSMPTDNDLRRDAEIRLLLTEHNLDPTVLTAISERNSAATAPYHGYQHLLSVALNAVAAARTLHMPGDDRAALILAALFHDVDHSAGFNRSDGYNIGLALGAFHRYSVHNHLDARRTLTIESLIRSTEFPHPAPRTLLEQVIQDADLMQTLEPDGKQFLHGLSQETGHPLSPADSDRFLSTVHLNTEWARDRLATHLIEGAL